MECSGAAIDETSHRDERVVELCLDGGGHGVGRRRIEGDPSCALLAELGEEAAERLLCLAGLSGDNLGRVAESVRRGRHVLANRDVVADGAAKEDRARVALVRAELAEQAVEPCLHLGGQVAREQSLRVRVELASRLSNLAFGIDRHRQNMFGVQGVEIDYAQPFLDEDGNQREEARHKRHVGSLYVVILSTAAAVAYWSRTSPRHPTKSTRTSPSSCQRTVLWS
mmetsp:Transcript_10237/g.33663  ORF Transcript_10237/g.33663 Transcript_10237/m.33663 type:complete len:225 (-) Transcript_10237:11-685(-)